MEAQKKGLTDNVKGSLYSAAGFSCFAIGDSGFKYLGDFYSIYLVALYASVVVLVALIAIMILQKKTAVVLQSAYKKEHCLRGLCLTAQFLCVIYAFTHLPMAKVYALTFVAPFITGILAAVILKEHLSLKHIMTIVLGFLGVLIILRPGMIPIETAAIVALSGALMFSLSNIAMRWIGMKNPDEPPLAFAFYSEIIIVAVCLVLAYPFLVVPPLLHGLIFTGIGLLSATALLLLARAFILAKASIAGTFQYIQIIWGTALGFLLFKDSLDIYTFAGAAIIIASGIWLLWHEGTKDSKDIISNPAH